MCELASDLVQRYLPMRYKQIRYTKPISEEESLAEEKALVESSTWDYGRKDFSYTPREFLAAVESGALAMVDFSGPPDVFLKFLEDIRAGKYDE